MTKAEEFAYSKYPKDRKGVLYNLARNAIKEGYNQAEKDLELTWEDIQMIDDCLVAAIDTKTTKRSKEEFYKEVLKRFNEQRQSKYNEE